MPKAGRGGAVVTGGHERVEAARLGWFDVHAQVGLAVRVAPVMPEVLATPGLLDFNQVSVRACLGWARADGDLPAVRLKTGSEVGGWPGSDEFWCLVRSIPIPSRGRSCGERT